ncbi:ACT domain-containing protein [Lentimicrobium sp. S6]|uniref:ACT domain-containing protein n=1 Tax=Lentimicrobium sp. S6 TaxID=2735872 RepID=UPI001554D85A|nr:ACT domain-containing protein [Lentimicrobium sp. S6]NPD47358.1 ACT domain-containing protein [Lentimicrobium sp. S6]
MDPELDINYVLKNLSPQLKKGVFVFCSIDHVKNIKEENIMASIVETEGRTIVLKKEIADSLKLPYSVTMNWITLNVNSSLELVGLSAIISKKFTDHHISCNLMAGYYHDHIFVPEEDSNMAIKLLHELSQRRKRKSKS